VTLRAQLPARSPLPARAIAAGVGALLLGGRKARARVHARIMSIYRPLDIALTDSGTSALALALFLASGRRPGRPVLLPAWGCFDLATAAEGANVPVMLYDLDPKTLGPDWESLERALALDPAAVVAVHYYGLPVDLDQLSSMAERAGVPLISDAAQGAGAELGGRPLGAWGDMAVLSFGRGKGMTGGRGGALLAHEDDWADAVEGLSLSKPLGGPVELATLAAQWLLARPAIYAIPSNLPWLRLGETIYHPPHRAEGLSAVAAGVLTTTIDLAEREAQVRRRNAAFLGERLAGSRLGVVRAAPGTDPGWLRLPVRLESGTAEAVEVDRTARGLGIYRSYPKPLNELPGMAARISPNNDLFPGAKELVDRLVTLPTHSAVGQADLERIIVWGRSGF